MSVILKSKVVIVTVCRNSGRDLEQTYESLKNILYSYSPPNLKNLTIRSPNNKKINDAKKGPNERNNIELIIVPKRIKKKSFLLIITKLDVFFCY